jgi:uncharacterized membrane protein
MIKLRQWWRDIRGSLWFLPGIIVLTAVAAAIGMIEFDQYLGNELFERWPHLFGSTAAGARGLLATVASSMITVAGVVFSITIVALSLASSQYTSRVLRNFMGNRINQSVLGVFVGIFAYCLVVLRTIRGGETTFVPSLAVTVGLLLAFVGIVVLIYFIHHISSSIQASQILATVSGETRKSIAATFPVEGGDDDEALQAQPAAPGQGWHAIAADKTGYLQNFDARALVAFARERDSVLRMECRVGEFVIEGAPIASLLGAFAAGRRDAQELGADYAVGVQRTVEQDPAFGIRQIVDVALKALSPGINDPTTAVMSVDYLTAILMYLGNRRIESRYRDDGGVVRLLTRGPTYADMVADAFDQIRSHASGNATVLACLLMAIGRVIAQTAPAGRRRTLAEHARAVLETGQRSLVAPRDRRDFEQRWQQLRPWLDAGAA